MSQFKKSPRTLLSTHKTHWLCFSFQKVISLQLNQFKKSKGQILPLPPCGTARDNPMTHPSNLTLFLGSGSLDEAQQGREGGETPAL